MTVAAAPVLAATLVLLRDGAAGLEVLMIARHEAMAFAAGAMVFPGGKVHADDAGLAGGRPEGALRVAAIRETFEETGILLADGGAGAAGLGARRGEPFAGLLAERGLAPAADRLVPFAHWITPVGRPRRFDTHFFAAAAPPDQDPAHDGREAVEARWISPAAAVAASDGGALNLVFATRLNLLRLARFATVAEALAAAAAAPVVTVLPELLSTPAGRIFRIPPGAGYDVTELPADLTRPP